MYVNVAHMAHVHLACNKFLIYTVKVHVVCTCMLHTVLVVHARTWLFTAIVMQVCQQSKGQLCLFGKLADYSSRTVATYNMARHGGLNVNNYIIHNIMHVLQQLRVLHQ